MKRFLRGRRSQAALAAVGLGCSALFTYLAVRGVRLSEMSHALRESNYWWLLPAFALLVVANLLRGFRWQYLFARETRPADVLSVGQSITVQVARIEKRDDPRRPLQISFSMKALDRDPWTEIAATLRPGSVTQGKVVRLEAFGAFVELAPGVEGLLHISELGTKRPIRHAREAVKPGESLTVTVLAVDEGRRRISLALGERSEGIDEEGRAAAARASGASGQLGTLGDLLKGKLPPR